MRTKTLVFGGAAFLAIALAPLHVATAQTLLDSIQLVHTSSIRIDLARSSVEIAQENVVQARAGLFPSVSLTAEALGRQPTIGLPGWVGEFTLGLELEQPIFHGYQLANGVSWAEAQVAISLAELIRVGQEEFLSAVEAFCDVYRDETIYYLSGEYREIVVEDADEIEKLVRDGAATQSDLAVAQAQLAVADTRRASASAGLASSLAIYSQVVGGPSAGLSRPFITSFPLFPATSNEAATIALAEHPSVTRAVHEVAAARLRVEIARGELMPAVDAIVRLDAQVAGGQANAGVAVLGRITVPLFGGGGGRSEIREAELLLAQAQSLLDQTRIIARAIAESAFAQLAATQARHAAATALVEARTRIVTEIEAGVAARDAALSELSRVRLYLVDARIALAGAERDLIANLYALQAALGRLRPEVFGLTSW